MSKNLKVNVLVTEFVVTIELPLGDDGVPCDIGDPLDLGLALYDAEGVTHVDTADAVLGGVITVQVAGIPSQKTLTELKGIVRPALRNGNESKVSSLPTRSRRREKSLR
jgi:hypothetical protein